MTAPSTYDLVRRLAAVVAGLEDSGGELTEASALELEAALSLAEDKGEALLAVEGRLATERDEAKSHAHRWLQRAHALDKAHGRVRALLLEVLQGRHALTGETRLQAETGTAYLTRTPPRVVGPEDPAAWPEDCRRIVTTTTVDRGAAKRLLDAGADLGPAIRIETTPTIRITR